MSREKQVDNAMSDIALRVENLSKRYRIGGPQAQYRTIRETMMDMAAAPARRLRRLGQPSPENETIWALKDVTFDVKKGEVVGIIGRNGAGKTTLLRILCRITEPTEGCAEIKGRVGSLLEVGTGFHPELTGRENIYLNGAILGMKRTEINRQFHEIVAFSEIEKFLDTPVKRYSSGMHVRLAFAVAAHLEPEILLVDEVLAVGDAAFQQKCLGKMGDVAREGRTVLFVSHNMAAVRKLCPQAMLLDSGRKKIAGPADSVIDQFLASTTSEISSIVALPSGPADAPGAGMSLRFFTEDDTPQAQFHAREAWRMVLDFEIFEPTLHVIAAVGLATLDSVSVITYWSKPKDLEPGRYSVEFECNLPLKRCDLQFAVGLSSHERAFYYVHRIGHVSISEVASGQQPFRTAGGGLLSSLQQSEIRPVAQVGGRSTHSWPAAI